jgi:hypothetical protein
MEIKLATKNIPSNAVDKVEVLHHYAEVPIEQCEQQSR